MTPRLLERYRSEIVPKLSQEFGFKNVHQVPRLEKVVVNMGVGKATQNAKLIEKAAEELAAITGQKAAIRKARKSIANFKLRQGQAVGCTVTLRGARMWEFFDRLVNVSLPRVRDFKGVSLEGVRRPRQLLARHPRADHLPRDRLRLGGEHHGAERHGRDERPQRRRGQGAARAPRHAVPP